MCAEHFSQLEAEINEKFASDKTFDFCDFLREDVKNEEGLVEIEAEKIYEGIMDKEKLRTRVYYLLDEYNTKYSSKKMPLVIFDDAMKHLLRISRCIQQ
jgi:dynein heavy chain